MDEIQVNTIKHKFGVDTFRNTSFNVRENTLYIFRWKGDTGIPVMTYAPGIWNAVETEFERE